MQIHLKSPSGLFFVNMGLRKKNIAMNSGVAFLNGLLILLKIKSA